MMMILYHGWPYDCLFINKNYMKRNEQSSPSDNLVQDKENQKDEPHGPNQITESEPR